jgi:hypothetical protein
LYGFIFCLFCCHRVVKPFLCWISLGWLTVADSRKLF